MLLQNRCLCTNTSHITIHSRGTCRYSSLNHKLTDCLEKFLLTRAWSHQYFHEFQRNIPIASLYSPTCHFNFFTSSLPPSNLLSVYFHCTLPRSREEQLPSRYSVRLTDCAKHVPRQETAKSVGLDQNTYTNRTAHNLMVSLLQNLWNDLTDDCTVILLRQLLWTFVAKMGPRSITNGW